MQRPLLYHSFNLGPPCFFVTRSSSAALEDPVEVWQVRDLDEGAVLGHGLWRVREVPLGVGEDGVLDARLPPGLRRRRRLGALGRCLVLERVVPGGLGIDFHPLMHRVILVV